MLPPEFIVFGITKDNFRPWTPIDCILMLRVISFHLLHNWSGDLQREAIR